MKRPRKICTDAARRQAVRQKLRFWPLLRMMPKSTRKGSGGQRKFDRCPSPASLVCNKVESRKSTPTKKSCSFEDERNLGAVSSPFHTYLVAVSSNAKHVHSAIYIVPRSLNEMPQENQGAAVVCFPVGSLEQIDRRLHHAFIADVEESAAVRRQNRFTVAS
jgi:hypothetical protein